MSDLLLLLLALLQVRLCKQDLYVAEEQVEDGKDSVNRESYTACAYK